jgi:biopolymer transport protein ExbD
MVFKTNCQIARGRIDPAPLVDVVFLLMIFLVLNAPYVIVPGVAVFDFELPTLRQAPSAFGGLVITVTETNLVFFENQPVKLEDLPRLLTARLQEKRVTELVIKADKRVPNGTLVQIMGLAFDSGVTAINLATRPALPTGP